MTTPYEKSDAQLQLPVSVTTFANQLRKPLEEQKTLQTTSEGRECKTALDSCALVIETNSADEEKLLAKRTYQMIDKLGEFLAFLVTMNESDTNSKSTLSPHPCQCPSRTMRLCFRGTKRPL